MNGTKFVTGLFAILLIVMMFAIPTLIITDIIEMPADTASHNASAINTDVISVNEFIWVISGFVLISVIMILIAIKRQNREKRNEKLIQGKENEISKIEKILQTMKREYENTKSVIGSTTIKDIENAQTSGEIPPDEAEVYIKRFKILEDKLVSLSEAIKSMETEIVKLHEEINGLSSPTPLVRGLDLRVSEKINNH